jgi:hypothetical protein
MGRFTPYHEAVEPAWDCTGSHPPPPRQTASTCGHDEHQLIRHLPLTPVASAQIWNCEDCIDIDDRYDTTHAYMTESDTDTSSVSPIAPASIGPIRPVAAGYSTYVRHEPCRPPTTPPRRPRSLFVVVARLVLPLRLRVCIHISFCRAGRGRRVRTPRYAPRRGRRRAGRDGWNHEREG